jgi:hypothetical protein
MLRMHNSKQVLVYSLRLCAGVLGNPPRLILTTRAPSKFIPGNQIFFEFSRCFLGSTPNSAGVSVRPNLPGSMLQELTGAKREVSKIVWNKRLARLVFSCMTNPPIPRICGRGGHLAVAICHPKLAVRDCAPHPTRRRYDKTILYATQSPYSVRRPERGWRSAKWGRKRTTGRVLPNS